MSFIALVFAALAALLSWLTPNHYPPWGSFHGEFLMAVALGLAMLGASQRKPPALPLSPLSALALLLALLPLAQAATGLISYAGDAWIGCAYLLGFGLSVRVGQRLAAQHNAAAVYEVLSGLFVAAAIASTGVALLQWLSIRWLGILVADVPPGGRPFANLGQPNHLSTLVFMGLVGLWFLYERGRLGRFTLALGSAYLCFGLAMTTSRTAWLAMPLLLGGLWLGRRRAGLRVHPVEIAALGSLFLATLLLWQPLNDLLLLSAGRGFAVQAEAGPRTILWSTALDAISRAPWFGYGWDQALVAQSSVVLDHPAGGRLMGSAHNFLLDLMLWAGVPLGAFTFCALLAWGWRHLRRAAEPVSVYVLAALAGVFAHAMVELPLSYTYFLLPAGLLAGLLEAAHPPRWRARIPAAWFALPVGAAATLLAAISFEYMVVEDNLRTLRLEVARIGTGRIVSDAPNLHLLTQWGAYLRYARMEPKTGMSAQELDLMDPLMRRFPYPRAQFDQALAYGLNGRTAQAGEVLRRLCALETKRHCADRLAEWRDLAAGPHPQLKAVEVPAPP